MRKIRKSNPEVARQLVDHTTQTSKTLALASEYYQGLYSCPEDLSEPELQDFLTPVTAHLTKAQRKTLDLPFSGKELFLALQSTDKSTAPGPDGIQYPVIQKYWGNIGPIFTTAAKKIMETGKLPEYFKRVLITLIFKSGQEESPDIKDLRTISLSNTVLKLISTAATSSLQKVSDSLIGQLKEDL